MNQTLLIELVDSFRAQSFYIHSPTADKMLNLAFYLWRTCCFICAVISRFIFVTNQRTATFWAMCDKLDFFTSCRTSRQFHSCYFRDNLPSFFHIHHVSDMKVERSDDVGIMKRGTANYSTRKLNRIQIGHRSNRTSSSYLISNFFEFGKCTFCLKLIGNCPTGRFCRIAQISLLAKRVYFQYDTVGCNRKVFAFYIPIINKIEYLLQGTCLTRNMRNLKAPLSCLL